MNTKRKFFKWRKLFQVFCIFQFQFSIKTICYVDDSNNLFVLFCYILFFAIVAGSKSVYIASIYAVALCILFNYCFCLSTTSHSRTHKHTHTFMHFTFVVFQLAAVGYSVCVTNWMNVFRHFECCVWVRVLRSGLESSMNVDLLFFTCSLLYA